MKDVIRIGTLMDIYGELLTAKQRNVLHCYINEDYSLQEIAELTGISRQAAHDTIKKAVRQLEKYEQVLAILKKNASIKQELLSIRAVLHGKGIQTVDREIDTIIGQL